MRAGSGKSPCHQRAHPPGNERLVLPPPGSDEADISYAAYIVRPVRIRAALDELVGAVLMLGSAYLHDTGMVKAGPAQPFVNWSTVIGMLCK
jgi:hypothetical protein